MKVVIIDDDRLVAASLKIILEADPEIEVLAEGYDGSEAIELYSRLQPDLLLMDIQMKQVSGVEAAKTILQQYPEAIILFLTTFSDDEYIVEALRMGVRGYLLKQRFEHIIPALHAALGGQSVFGGEISSRIPQLLQNTPGFDYGAVGIQSREWEIIEYVSQGLNNHEIAEKMFLSEGTIRNYLSIILDKLQLRDRTQLAVFYYQNKNSGQ
ncbi:MAG: response regulator [Lachnospiraceae bacterium]